ncbi:beta-ketoacyl-ACP synthase [Acidisphaera rubrifaciens]|uniref:beta-ketoacyl-ACP synthase n=1 Tax=Acidisphaera rubrifaciens TaxID=50715 RepID=UPI001F5262B9|nr:beta-ketoacyl-ACP synthase [Acidisphaera rubrifaciens]
MSAATAVSAVGHGRAAHARALRARRGGLRPNDYDPAVGGWIGRVEGVEEHRLPAALAAYDCRNHRLADMALDCDGFAAAVGRARARHGADRIAVVLGTSTSGVTAAEDAYRARAADGALPDWFDFDNTQDLGALARFVRDRLGLRGPALSVSTACASSARSFMDAAALIRVGIVDAAVVGGADSLCRMTLHGFAALELLAPDPCRPCAADRAGISIGEAAGFALLERAGEGEALLLGAGASSDGYHMSAPHPEGAGAVAAMRTALDAAGLAPDAIDWINLHGTATRANDAIEDMAVAAVFGDAVPASSTKGWTGHTLGACGILETVIALECMRGGFVAGCLGIDAADPAFTTGIAVANTARPVRRVLSNSFGFGGINCSLILGSAA